MIKNGHYYPDWIWKNKLHYDHEKQQFDGSCAFCYIEGNKRGGKSVGVGIYALVDWFKYKYRCVYICRYQDDIENSGVLPVESFWKKCWRWINSDEVRVKDIDDHELSFKGHKVYIDGELFCYPVSLNKANKFKSGDFDNVHLGIYDECVAEDGTELPDEVFNLYLLYDTIARSRDDALKDTSIVLISNCITKASSIKEELGIAKEIRNDTKRLLRKQYGYCYERVLNSIVQEEIEGSAIAKLQRHGEVGKRFLGYAQNNEFRDNESFVMKKPPRGNYVYMDNVTYNGKTYAIKFYKEEGLYYFTSSGIDNDYPNNYALTRQDHSFNTVLLYTPNIKRKFDQYKLHFGAGNFRFNTLATKNVFMDIYKYL